MTARVPESQLPDAEARRIIREELDTTLVVEAAAGTGKTTMLVARIIALLRTGRTSLRRVVAVTFTDKAAGEMKLRLREEVEKARTDPQVPEVERRRLDTALEELEAARISTIHSLCSDLLRERPVEARVDPVFEVGADARTRVLEDQAFDAWYREHVADPPEGLRRALRRSYWDGPRDALRWAARSVVDTRDFDAAWRRDAFDRDAEVDAMLREIERVASFGRRSERADGLADALQALERWADEVARQEALRGGRDYDGLEAKLADLAAWRMNDTIWRPKGSRRPTYGPGLTRETVLGERDALKARLDDFVARSEADIAACLHAELQSLVTAYEELKERTGGLDFRDLLIRMRDLVAQDATVREELQERFDYVLVDEFQDTDPLQAQILLLMAAEDPAEADWTTARPKPGKLFVVGDPKQSIYRFRRADVVLYERIKARLVAAGAKVVHLQTSFRGVPAIQQAVNAAFGKAMQPEEGGSQATYVPLMPFRDAIEGQPGVVALPAPAPYGSRYVSKKAISESLPVAVGAFVDWLVRESGWTVFDEGERVPIRPRHVCMLFKRMQSFRSDVALPYTIALEARQIPHVRVGGRSFHQREEVGALRAALAAIEWPGDELNVFATLRGPLFALSDDQLLVWRGNLGRLHPMRRVDVEELDEHTRPVAEALEILGRLHLGRNRRPIADTVSELLEVTRAHAGLAFWQAGEQVLANVLRVLDLAREFEASGATSFRAFVDHMLDAAERQEDADAPVVEEGTEGVRVLTVHKAKGLEFPVVILCDPTAASTHRRPSHHVDAERGLWVQALAGCAPVELQENAEAALRLEAEESVRLVYVAATRAQDLLVVPVVGDEERSGWLEVLNPAVYPSVFGRREPREAPGCPPFGPDSVCVRPPERMDKRDECVMPGAHTPREGEHEVVWWDPFTLALDRERDASGQRDLLLKEDDEGRSLEGLEAHDRWQLERMEVAERGASASLSVRTFTEVAKSLPERFGVEPVVVERVERPAVRVGGKRFGTLVHAVLAEVPLEASGEVVETLARAHGRLLGAPPSEVKAAASTAARALEHAVMRRAAAADEVRREVPVVMALEGGAIGEGVVDLAFREGDRWIIVDYKTDAELDDERREGYEEQVRLYVDAVQAATGCAAEGVLLLV